MTIFNIRTAAINELPLSLVNGNADDLVNSSNQGAEELQNQSLNADKRLTKYEYKNKPKNIKKYKKSNTYKITMLYSTPSINTYRLIEKTVLDEEEKKQKVKNVFGQPVLEDVKVSIGGHKGLMKLNEKYISSWVYVDTLNEFTFNSNTFHISNNLKKYEVKADNKCEMEKVLCYYLPERNEYRFFDENIDEITKHIK